MHQSHVTQALKSRRPLTNWLRHLKRDVGCDVERDVGCDVERDVGRDVEKSCFKMAKNLIYNS